MNANPIEQCLNTAHEYFIAVDEQAPQRIAATFAEDGTLTLSGNKMVGRKAIADYFAQPSNGRQLQHHLTTWQIKEQVWHNGKKVPVDYDQLTAIIKGAGYTGYLPLETLNTDPKENLPKMIEEMRKRL